MKNPENCIDDGGGVRWPVNFYFFGKIEILLPQEFTQKEFCKLLGGNSLGSQAAVNGWANCYKNEWAKKEVGLDVLLGLHPDVSGLRLQHSIEPIQAETPRRRRLVPAWSTAAGAACPSPRPDYYCRHCTAQQASKTSWSPQRPDLPAHGLLL